MEEQTNQQWKHLPAEVRQVEARFYPNPVRAPIHVVIDGVVYRREQNQERLKLSLQEDDLFAALEPLVSPEAARLIWELSETISEYRILEVTEAAQQLRERLPNHTLIINDALYPGCESVVTVVDSYRHAHCVLP